ncbi:hypothetical protein [Amycolatopsis sp. lyj-112]|uniref:hypothetical protein n=1 Tax=Amycolatopsis sp. lyj-112 TaxID=2789288 RepID=UPI00397DDC9F
MTTTDTANWIFFCLGVLSAAGATFRASFPVRSPGPYRPPRPSHPVLLLIREIAMWSPVVVGPLLLLGGAVLLAVTTGRLSWLTVLSGAVCLAVFALLRLETVHGEVARQLRGVEAEQQGMRGLQREVTRLDTTFRSVKMGLELSRGSDPLLRVPLLEFQDMLQDVVRDAVAQRDMNPSVAAEVAGEVTGTVSDLMRVEFTAMFGQLGSELMLWRENLTNEVRGALAGEGVRPTWVATDFSTFTQSMTAAGLWAPVSVYTAADEGTALKDAVVRVLREFGLEVAVEEPPVRGSWWQRFWARSREVADSEPVRDRLAKLERALELEALGKRQAEIDKAKAEAVAALHAVVKEQENAVVRLGSIVMIKKAGDLVVFTVSEMQAAVMEKHSELLRDPVAALNFLHDGRPPGKDDWHLAAGPDPASHRAVTDHDKT